MVPSSPAFMPSSTGIQLLSLLTILPVSRTRSPIFIGSLSAQGAVWVVGVGLARFEIGEAILDLVVDHSQANTNDLGHLLHRSIKFQKSGFKNCDLLGSQDGDFCWCHVDLFSLGVVTATPFPLVGRVAVGATNFSTKLLPAFGSGDLGEFDLGLEDYPTEVERGHSVEFVEERVGSH